MDVCQNKNLASFHFVELSSQFYCEQIVVSNSCAYRLAVKVCRKALSTTNLLYIPSSFIEQRPKPMDLIKDQAIFDTDEFIFREGDPGDYAYIIDSGCVEVSSEKDGRQVVVARLAKGDILGEMAIIDRKPRMASAKAIEPTVVLPIPLDYVTREVEGSDPTVRLFLRLVVARYRELSQRFAQILENFSSKQDGANSKHKTTGEHDLESTDEQFVEMHKRIDSVVKEAEQTDFKMSFCEQSLEMTKQLVAKDRALKSALANEEFCLHYQPILDLKSNQIIGCEALVRWNHPSGELLFPGDFLSHVERSGQIVELGYWIAKEACEFQRRISEEHGRELTMSINLSGKQFEDQELVPKLIAIMDEAGVKREKIKFEITESLLIDNPELASESLNQLICSGAKLAIDDFGTGYSSFSYLCQFSFDTLKIDRAFVGSMENRKKSDQIVKSLIHLSQGLGMDVVAEGVESEVAAEMLGDYDSVTAQGYYFSPPVSESDFLDVLANENELGEQAACLSK